jgi:hypothetical protein
MYRPSIGLYRWPIVYGMKQEYRWKMPENGMLRRRRRRRRSRRSRR